MNTTTRNKVTAMAVPLTAEPTVLMWSQSQNCLHIEPLSWMLDSNRRAYGADQQMDYVPLFIGPEDQCDAAAETMRQTLQSRENYRTSARELIETARLRANQ